MFSHVTAPRSQCVAKIADIASRTGNSHFVGVFSYAGMPYEEAERNMRLFARTVMPEVQRLAPAPAGAAAEPGAEPMRVGLLGS